MMKNTMKFLVLATILLGFAGVSFGQTSDVENTQASAAILTPIQLSETQDLKFGTVGAIAGASTVILSTSGNRTGTATTYTLTSSPVTAAGYTVLGTPSASYNVVLPGNSDVTLTGPGPAMAVTNFVSLYTTGSAYALDNAGTQSFTVGATLNVGPTATQTAGQYSGTFNVTVNYN